MTEAFVSTPERKIGSMPKFEIIRDDSEGFWWRLSDGNGESLAYSAKTYSSRGDCARDIELMKFLSSDAEIDDRAQAGSC